MSQFELFIFCLHNSQRLTPGILLQGWVNPLTFGGWHTYLSHDQKGQFIIGHYLETIEITDQAVVIRHHVDKTKKTVSCFI